MLGVDRNPASSLFEHIVHVPIDQRLSAIRYRVIRAASRDGLSGLDHFPYPVYELPLPRMFA